MPSFRKGSKYEEVLNFLEKHGTWCNRPQIQQGTGLGHTSVRNACIALESMGYLIQREKDRADNSRVPSSNFVSEYRYITAKNYYKAINAFIY